MRYTLIARDLNTDTVSSHTLCEDCLDALRLDQTLRIKLTGETLAPCERGFEDCIEVQTLAAMNEA